HEVRCRVPRMNRWRTEGTPRRSQRVGVLWRPSGTRMFSEPYPASHFVTMLGPLMVYPNGIPAGMHCRKTIMLLCTHLPAKKRASHPLAFILPHSSFRLHPS